jgi:hypothetical protein
MHRNDSYYYYTIWEIFNALQLLIRCDTGTPTHWLIAPDPAADQRL